MGAGQSGGPDITAVVPAQPCVSVRCVHLWKVLCPCSPADPEQSQTHTSTGRVPSSSGLAGPYGAGCGEDRLWPAITLAVGLHLPFLGRGAEPQLQSPAGCVREFGAQLLCLALPQPHLLQGPGVGCSGRLPSLLCPLLRGGQGGLDCGAQPCSGSSSGAQCGSRGASRLWVPWESQCGGSRGPCMGAAVSWWEEGGHNESLRV